MRNWVLTAAFALVCSTTTGIAWTAAPTAASASPTLGQWSSVETWPLLPIHSTITSEGKLLTFGATQPGTSTGLGDKYYDVWDPATNTHTTTFQDSHDYFCSVTLNVPETGETLIAGGDDFVSGSTGNTLASFYDPSTGAVTSGPPMTEPRWYPNGTTLPSGELLVQGGYLTWTDWATTPEIYNTATGWRSLTGADSDTVYGVVPGGERRWWYPRSWVDPNGNVFGIAQSLMYTLDTSGVGSLTTHGQLPATHRGRATSSAVMYEPGKILQVGGGGQTNVDDTTLALKTAAIIDITSGVPVVTPVADMNYPRHWVNATVLPNGQVLINGGSEENNELTGLALPSEIWDPTTQAWTVVASEAEARLYHSSSVLLPDGRVFSGGGGQPGPVINESAQFFTPPYLFNPDGSPATRPAITWSSPKLAYGAGFAATVQSGQTVSRVTLVKSGATTHSFNADQRFLELSFTQTGDDVSITAPANNFTATPGYYLLSVIDQNGVVSESKMVSLLNSTTAGDVLLQPPDTESPSVTVVTPAGGSIEPGPVVTVAGQGSDNVGVSSMRLHVRDQTPGQPVQYWDGTQWVGNWSWFTIPHTDGAYSEDLTLPTGNFLLRAYAYDSAGNLGFSGNTFMSVGSEDTESPSVTVVTPAGGSIEPGPVVTVAGQGSDNVGVSSMRLHVRDQTPGQPVQYWDGTQWVGNWSWFTIPHTDGAYSEDLTLPAGDFRLRAYAYDSAGNLGSSDFIYMSVGSEDTESPSVTVVTPAGGSIEPGPVVTVAGQGSDNVGVSSMRLHVRDQTPGQPVQYWDGTQWVGNWSWFTIPHTDGAYSEDLTLPAGDFRLRAYAYDSAGNLGSSDFIYMSVGSEDTESPSVTVVTPAGGSIEPGPVVTVAGQGSDNVGVSSMRLHVRDQTPGQPVQYWDGTQWVGNWSWFTIPHTDGAYSEDLTLPAGNFLLRAYAYDSAGNLGFSGNTFITVS